MSRLPYLLLSAGLVLTHVTASLHGAEAADPAVARMRDALKTASTQLAAAQNELAAAQSAAADGEQRTKTAEARVAVLTKQAIADRVESDKVLAVLNTKLAATIADNAFLSGIIKQQKTLLEEKSRMAQTESAEHARLDAEVIALGRRLSDLETKNVALIELSNEILSRYKEFSLGEALKAKEPFVGSTRVKLENFAQDYKDKIRDQRANP